MYNTHPHISTQEVSTSAKKGDERTWLQAAIRKSSRKIMALVVGSSTVSVTNGWPVTTRSDVT